MTRDELFKLIAENTNGFMKEQVLRDAVDAYTEALIAAKPIVMRGQSPEQFCGCGNELTEKEVYYEYCLKCGRIADGE